MKQRGFVIEVRDLCKNYDGITAVAGVSFSVERGEIFGLLGPNGAGKTTTIHMLCCLLRPTAGTVVVDGVDAVLNPSRVKELIGVVPQDIALYPTLSGRDNLAFWGRMCGLKGSELRDRMRKALEIVGLSARAGEEMGKYSGGMKRRLNLAAGLMHRPTVLFLDEPTVGVDPQSRNHIFENVKRLNEEGVTVVYTTHYMEEAERLCHRVAVMDEGKIVALDTPASLVSLLGGGLIRIGVPACSQEILSKIGCLAGVKDVSVIPPAGRHDGTELGPDHPLLKVEAHQARQAVLEVISLFGELDLEMLSLEILEPNLESVFLHLTGKRLRD
ncbi:MAG: ATP-binding cassette domain-containing protein [Candidatus Eisenbacteria bacterium]